MLATEPVKQYLNLSKRGREKERERERERGREKDRERERERDREAERQRQRDKKRQRDREIFEIFKYSNIVSPQAPAVAHACRGNTWMNLPSVCEGWVC